MSYLHIPHIPAVGRSGSSRRESVTTGRALGGRTRAGALIPRLAGRARQMMAAALAVLGKGLILLTGVTLVVAGVGLTGGSFGLLAFIGMPLLVLGLGLIGAAQSIILGDPAGPGRPLHQVPAIPSTNPSPGEQAHDRIDR